MSFKKGEIFWGDIIADRVVETFPNQEKYICAAGISPSGIVHFGNFREIITSHVVAERLRARGHNAELLFIWDDFDRFRKVPSNAPNDFEKYIGLPLSQVPSIESSFSSYAEQFQKPLEDAANRLGIPIQYRYQTDAYKSGMYDKWIIHALQNREKIAHILLSFMTEKGKQENGINPQEYVRNFYPISVYSNFTGRDNTCVLDYDGDKQITYQCLGTDQKETIDITKQRIVKLVWKVDWPMRWAHDSVNFEPAGADHAAPGSSFNVGSQIVQDIFGWQVPVFEEYKFVGLQGQGAKMSGSKGNVISPGDLLEIYTPDLLKWLYIRKQPRQSFEIALGDEVYRQYQEFDMAIAGMHNGANSTAEDITLEIAGITKDSKKTHAPFRQVASFGQIVGWNQDKLTYILDELGTEYDSTSLQARMGCAAHWLGKYQTQDLIKLRDVPDLALFSSLSDEQSDQIQKLHNFLTNETKVSITELEHFLYAIPRDDTLPDSENKKRQKAFFSLVYRLLIDSEKGPRLATFLWAMDRGLILRLLTDK